MFNMKIVDSDSFLDMPLSTQCLYFHLNMRADDDGFIGNPKRIQKLVGASDDDLKLLMAKRFVLSFESGVIVIKHWRMHNTLSTSRYCETTYIDEKSHLLLKENKSYSFNSGVAIDDTKQIEMSKRQNRRTLDEKKTNPDIDIDLDIDLDKKEKNIKKKKDEKPVITLLMKTGDDYLISEEDIKEWQMTFKNVDVLQELKLMQEWCKSNPNKRKTKSGMRRFITNWLTRNQKQKPSNQSGFNVTKFDVN